MIVTARELRVVETFVVRQRAHLAHLVVLRDADLEIGVEIAKTRLRQRAGNVFVAHLAIEAFEIARQLGDIEQRAGLAIGQKARARDFKFAPARAGKMDGA